MMLGALGNVLAQRIFLPAEALRLSPTNAGVPSEADTGSLVGLLSCLTPRQIDADRAAARGLPSKLRPGRELPKPSAARVAEFYNFGNPSPTVRKASASLS